MSEEEKKAIKALKIFNKIVEMVKFNYMGLDEEEKEFVNNNDYVYNTKKSIITVLNLIENQQKELNNLKKIEQSHQEENGKLRVFLTKQDKMIHEAYAKANNYLYFNDSSDYEAGLWEVIRSLRPDLAEKWDNGDCEPLKYIEEESE